MYQGFFINLGRDEKRRQSLTDHLEQIGAAHRYQRFEAVDGRTVAHEYDTELDPGGLGCWLSHLNLLRANRSSDVHLHVIEDDTIFAKSAPADFEAILRHCEAQSRPWDLIFTDVFFPPELRTFKEFSAAIETHKRTGACSVVGLANINFAGTSSYFVNKRSIDRVADVLAETARAGLPIDLFIRALVQQKVLKAFVTVPFLTSLSPESWQSNISSERNLSQFVYYVLRRAFFKEADRESLLTQMQEITTGIEFPTLPALYLQCLSFYLSDRWVDF